MVFNTIDKLREKPEHHRRRVAMGISGLITLFIFSVWVSVHLPQSGTAQVAAVQEAPSARDTRDNTEGPLDTLRAGVASIYEAIRNFGEGDDKSFTDEYEKIKKELEEGEIEFIPGER